MSRGADMSRRNLHIILHALSSVVFAQCVTGMNINYINYCAALNDHFC